MRVVGRVLLGAVLVVLATVPFYRYADRPEAGMAGRAVVELVDSDAGLLWSGTLVLVLAGLVVGVLAGPGVWDRPLARIASWLGRLSPAAWTAALFGSAFAVTYWFTTGVLDGKPNLIDGLSQLVHARYLAAGSLAGPVPEAREFWAFHNMVFSDAGWVSHFPPGHSAWLAPFVRVGLQQLSGAVAMAVTSALTYLTLRRLLPGRELEARVGALMVAVGPFLLSQAGSYMNHGPAAALGTLVVYATLRARDGRAAWAVVSGAALGLLVTTRPLFAAVMGFGVALPIGLGALRRGIGSARFRTRSALVMAGATPFVAVLLAYNARFFGGPLTFGYDVTGGPAVGLGFHVDPWGNAYSPAMAVALTSADLTALNLALLEMPLPLIALIGLWLTVARGRLPEGVGVLLAWAVVPVAANFFYWHHGHFMGPRMLSDSAPAWAGLVTLAVVELIRLTPRTAHRRSIRFAPRTAAITALVLGVVAAAYLAPLRLVRRGGDYLPSMRLEAPAVEGPSLVFVHGAWSGRVFARMVADGRPLHEIGTALRQNGLCRIQQGLARPESGILESLDLEPRAVTPDVVEVEPFPGNTFVVDRDRFGRDGSLRLPADCVRELHADRHGTVEVTVYYWQGDLPGLGVDGTMYVRDMGPDRNRRLLERYADRTPYLLTRSEPRGMLRMLPYETGQALLWEGVDQ